MIAVVWNGANLFQFKTLCLKVWFLNKYEKRQQFNCSVDNLMSCGHSWSFIFDGITPVFDRVY